MTPQKITKVANGVFESNDEDGYKNYIFKRNTKREIDQIRTQLNSVSAELAELKQMLQQIIKV